MGHLGYNWRAMAPENDERAPSGEISQAAQVPGRTPWHERKGLRLAGTVVPRALTVATAVAVAVLAYMQFFQADERPQAAVQVFEGSSSRTTASVMLANNGEKDVSLIRAQEDSWELLPPYTFTGQRVWADAVARGDADCPYAGPVRMTGVEPAQPMPVTIRPGAAVILNLETRSADCHLKEASTKTAFLLVFSDGTQVELTCFYYYFGAFGCPHYLSDQLCSPPDNPCPGRLFE